MTSVCPRCENNAFELEEVIPLGSNYKMFFVQCTSCKAAISATEYYDAGVLVHEQEKRFDSIDKTLLSLEQRIADLSSVVQLLARKIP
jgi:predicted nucleic-acid-binding Zn-ribbon protein